MINIYTGRPGNGKSYHAVLKIYNLLRTGSNVITNIDIDVSLIKKCKGEYIYIDEYDFNDANFFMGLYGFAMNFHSFNDDGKITKEGQTWLIIDEAQQDYLLNARTWNNSNRKDWNRFFQLHRHYGFNVLLVSQDLNNIDKQTQRLIQQNIEHRKFSNFNLICKLISIITFHTFFICIERDMSLKRSPKAARMSAYTLISRKKIYELYNSYTVTDFRV